jgi:3D-(3,5/4)-trihydroxycyclohexane-1,2-dione acylhydrolase (decyclizing)
VSANDCFRPVSRYFDRITRPEQIVPALSRAISVLTDPAECGPVTLAFCQDVQTEAYDYPASFFDERVHYMRRIAPDAREIEEAAAVLKQAKKPFVVCGGGVLYSNATSPPAMEFRLARRRPASRRRRSSIRSQWARSASPAPARPIPSPRKRT